jgi:hypothetical protein
MLRCHTSYYSGESCSGSYLTDGTILEDPSGSSIWTPRSFGATVAAGTASMMVVCSGIIGDSQIDKTYVNTSGDYF